MNDQQKGKGIGYILIGMVIFFSLMLSIKPEIILQEGDSLDGGYMLSKTLFVIFTLYTFLTISLKLIKK